MGFTPINRDGEAIKLISLQKELSLDNEIFEEMHLLLSKSGVFRFSEIAKEDSPKGELYKAVWDKVTTAHGLGTEDQETYQLLIWQVEAVLKLPLRLVV